MRYQKVIGRVLLLSAASIAFCASAQAQGNSIRGKVRNPGGQNVSRLIVHLETGNGSPINVVTTNNEGDFIFQGLAETSYTVVISSPEFEEVREHVDFVRSASPDSPGESRTLDIVLTPKGASRTPVPSNRTISGQTVPKEARDAMDRAVKLGRDNKEQEYVSALHEAVKAFPDYLEAHLMLAADLLKNNRLDDAISEFEVARKINPKDDRVYQGFGQVLMKQKKYALASQVFGEAVRLNPADATLPLLRASALIEHATAINPNTSKEASEERQKALTMAEQDLKRSIDIGGKSTGQAHLQLARLYEKRGDRRRAADELEAYLKVEPDAKNAQSIRDAIKTLRSQ